MPDAAVGRGRGLGVDVECPYCQTVFTARNAANRPPAPPPLPPSRPVAQSAVGSGRRTAKQRYDDEDDDDRPRNRRRPDDDEDDDRPSRPVHAAMMTTTRTSGPAGGGGGRRHSSESKRITAGVLAILLGGWGVHKFYLGYTSAGLIQLVLTLRHLWDRRHHRVRRGDHLPGEVGRRVHRDVPDQREAVVLATGSSSTTGERMIRFACPGCSATYTVGEDRAGKVTRCPKCQTKFLIPEPDAEVPAGACAAGAAIFGLVPIPASAARFGERTRSRSLPCPKCQTRLSVMPADLGLDVECPSCQTIVQGGEARLCSLPAPPPAPPRRSALESTDDDGAPKSRRRVGTTKRTTARAAGSTAMRTTRRTIGRADGAPAG